MRSIAYGMVSTLPTDLDRVAPDSDPRPEIYTLEEWMRWQVDYDVALERRIRARAESGATGSQSLPTRVSTEAAAAAV